MLSLSFLSEVFLVIVMGYVGSRIYSSQRNRRRVALREAFVMAVARSLQAEFPEIGLDRFIRALMALTPDYIGAFIGECDAGSQKSECLKPLIAEIRQAVKRTSEAALDQPKVLSNLQAAVETWFYQEGGWDKGDYNELQIAAIFESLNPPEVGEKLKAAH